MLSLLLLLPVAARADDEVLRGTVRDKGGESVHGVMVTLKDSIGNIMAYTSSGRDGEFVLQFAKIAGKATLTFSSLGYGKQTMPLRNFRNGSTVTLEEAAIQIKEVTVKAPPISARGDTLTYTVSSFRNASDRTIEDVLKKLPGITVEGGGRIYYNSEPINKFYIEGLDLVSGRYALATKNISPDDVQAVNVYENHQPRKVLKDIKLSDRAAINLKLKKKSLLKPIGYLKGGAGASDGGGAHWLGEAFGMLIAPRCQTLITIKGNDAGRSYAPETKSLTEGSMKGSIALDVYPLEPFGKADIPADRYYDNRSASASVNNVLKLGKDTKLNFNADYSDESIRYTDSQTTTYAAGSGESITVDETADNNPHLREAKLRVGFEENSDGRFLSDQFSASGLFNTNRYDITGGSRYHQGVSTRDYNVRNTFGSIFKLSGNMLDFSSDTQLSSTPRNRLTALCDGDTTIVQNVSGLFVMNKESLSYSWNINADSYIGLRTTFELNYNIFRSAEELSAQSAGNDIAGHDIATTLEPHYQCRFAGNTMLNVSAPLRFSNLRYTDDAGGSRHRTDRMDVDFRASLSHRFPFNLRSVLTVGRQNNLGGMSDYIVNPIHTTFRQTSRLGPGRLSRRTSYYATTNMMYRNAMEGLFGTATVMYRRSTSNRLGGIDVSSAGNIQSSSSSIDNKSDMLNATLSMSKKIYGWGTTFTADGTYELIKREVMRQNRVLGVDLNNLTGHLSVNSNPIGDYLIVDLDVRHSLSVQTLAMTDSDSRTRCTTASIKLSTCPVKGLELSASGYCSRTRTGGEAAVKCFFVDCGARYRVKKFDIELTARNLTNASTYGYTRFRDADIYVYSFRLRPLETLLTVKYSF